MTLSAAHSQTAVEAWVRHYGNQVDAYDMALKVATDSTGNVVVAGLTDDGANGRDFLIFKLSEPGTLLWANRYAGVGTGGDFLQDLAVDGNGRVFVAGSSWNGASDECVTIAYSAGGTPLWTNRHDLSPKALAVDSSGDLILTGLSNGGSSGADYLTIKYSGDGTPLWTNRYAGPGDSLDQPSALALDGNGNIFVTGESGPPFSGTDYLTVAYSHNGVPLWTNRYDFSGSDSASAVALDGSGNVIVTGTIYIDFGDYDYATIKYSGDGVPLWTNLYNGFANGEDQVRAVAVDSSGNVFVTGNSDSGGLNQDCATVAYSSAGLFLWENRYGGPANQYDSAYVIAVDQSGNAVVTGTSTATNGLSDYLTLAYSSAGVALWTNLYNGSGNGNDSANAVAVDTSGNVVVTGGSLGLGRVDDYDCVTIKYSEAGAPLWTNRYNGPGYGSDGATSIAVDGNGNVVVTGSSSASGTGLDYATVKYSGAGVPLWTNRYPSGWVAAVVTDGNGNVFVTGNADFDFTTVAYSDAGVPLWTNRYNGPANSHDRVHAMGLDNNGNVFVTGSSYGNSSGADYATIRYSNAGLPIWTNRYNGPGNFHDEVAAIAVDGSGNVIVTGYSYDNDTPYPDYATIKYSGAGVPLWTNRYNGTANDVDEAKSLAVDKSGNVFVTGGSRIDGASHTVTFKYSAAGATLWTRVMTEPGVWLAVDGGGDFAITGISYEGSPHYVTVKYSGAGVPLWTNRFGVAGGGDSRPYIAVDGNGNVIVTASSSDGVVPSNYPIDYLTVAYSAGGTPLWTNRYDGPKHNADYVQAVAVDTGGNLFVTGQSFGANFDFATIKYSVAGLSPIPLNHQLVGNQLVLSWTNTAFSLESAPAVQGVYTNVSGATSPYTNAFSEAQRYFRLKGN